MLKCDNVHELLWAYCEGSLESETGARVKQHLSTCALCAREHRAAMATLEGLGKLSRIEPADDFLGKVWQRIDEREASQGLLGLGVVWSWLRVNRTVVVAGSLAFFIALIGVRYGLESAGPPRMEVAGEKEAGAARTTAESGYRDDYILRDIPETTPVVSGFDAGGQDTIETRFITRDVVPSVPYSNDYIQPVVQPVSDDDSAF
jgi:hypothetical protein